MIETKTTWKCEVCNYKEEYVKPLSYHFYKEKRCNGKFLPVFWGGLESLKKELEERIKDSHNTKARDYTLREILYLLCNSQEQKNLSEKVANNSESVNKTHLKGDGNVSVSCEHNTGEDKKYTSVKSRESSPVQNPEMVEVAYVSGDEVGVMKIPKKCTCKINSESFTWELWGGRNCSLMEFIYYTTDGYVLYPYTKIIGYCNSKELSIRPRNTGISILFEQLNHDTNEWEKMWFHIPLSFHIMCGRCGGELK